MRSNIAFIKHRAGLNLSESGTEVTLRWSEYDSLILSGAGNAEANGEYVANGLVYTRLTAPYSTISRASDMNPWEVKNTSGVSLYYSSSLTSGWSGASAPYPTGAFAPVIDPVTQARQGTPVARVEVVRCFVHYVSTAMSQVRQFNEVEEGDCLLDMPADVALTGREGLSFEISGERWALKKVGDKLTRSWDQVFHGERLFRTVLLRKV